MPDVENLSQLLGYVSNVSPHIKLHAVNQLKNYIEEDIHFAQYVMWYSIRVGDVTLFKDMLDQYPELKKQPIYFPVSRHKLSHYKPLPNNPMSLLEAITSFGGDLNDNMHEPRAPITLNCLIACFGPNWMYDAAPKDFVYTVDFLLYTIFSLPESERSSVAIQHLETSKLTLGTGYSESVLSLLSQDESISLLSMLIKNEKSERELNRIFNSLGDNLGKIAAKHALDLKDFPLQAKQVACKWLETNDANLVSSCEKYINSFVDKYNELMPKKDPLAFFAADSKPDILHELKKANGFVAKFYLIKEESENPQSFTAQVVEQLALQSPRTSSNPK